MMNNQRKGFTLIEILIVVAIIAILASVVLVGLGPTQSLGRDARRVSDVHETINGLELYYNKQGSYPVAGASWNAMGTALTGASVGVNSIPNDPTTSKNYVYATDAAGTFYVVAALLENGTGGSWNGYSAPTNHTTVTVATPGITVAQMTAATGCTAAGTPANQYCVSL
ncbi:MAG TPA: prepilin-type N-terminal cleavage/methylation domain-containing protein [Candidatus Paceibacterota bacterium]